MVFKNKESAGISRSDIKVLSNVQILPPRQERNVHSEPTMQPLKQVQKQQWITVSKKSKAKAKTKTIANKNNRSTVNVENNRSTVNVDKVKIKAAKIRLSKTAAISIKGTSKEFSYAEALRQVRSEISFKEMDIQMPRVRRDISGNTIIEIIGKDNVQKADRLAKEMQRILQDKARIIRPNIRGEIKLYGMDSITGEEIREAIILEEQCKPEEIRMGKIGRTRNVSGVVWIQCPKVTAVSVAEKKRIQIGWSSVRVELLKSRPLQCHRCWRNGHVRETYRSNVDYSGCCFRCGTAGHATLECTNKIQCRVCVDCGLNGDHRMGFIQCTGINTPSVSKRRKSLKENQPTLDAGNTLPTEDPKRNDLPSTMGNRKNSPVRKTDEIKMVESDESDRRVCVCL